MNQLPTSLKPYFWDVSFESLDTTKYANFVIGRLLDKGSAEAASWVLNNYSRDDIQRTFMTIRDFSPKTANFWSIYLDIPRDKIVCLQEPYLRLRRSHWPY